MPTCINCGQLSEPRSNKNGQTCESSAARRTRVNIVKPLYARTLDFRLAAWRTIRARSFSIASDISCLTSRAFIGSSQ